MNAIDYSRSFVTFVTRNRGNNARLQLEAKCVITDAASAKTDEYYLFASCKSENTFSAKDLFQKENYDFCGIFGREEFVIFRAGRECNNRYAERGLWADRFENLLWQVREASGTTVLQTNEEIVRATLAGHPLVGRTEITSSDGKLKALLEFPIKTMNVNDIRMIYQVDTGPLPFPELDRGADRHIDRFELAFVAYNALGFADFVIQTETPVSGAAKTYHYSDIRSVPARNCVVQAG
jgi:hypothetical protein